MATLCQYRTGDGFYIRGFVPGSGPCTWQIGPKGLDYLSKRGIVNDRDRVSPRELEYLRDQSLIWTGGSGPGSSEVSTVPLETARLISDLRSWATTGKLDDLTPILYGVHGDQRDRSFSNEFLNWLGRLDSAGNLHHFDEISSTDFDELARPKIGRLVAGTLHFSLVSCAATSVLWRFARLVGLVSRQQQGCTTCPHSWLNQPVLQRLFALLQQLSTVSSPEELHARSKQVARVLPPTIVWEVDGQNVVALFPRQRLPAGVREISWQITADGGIADPTINPSTFFDNDEFWVEESRSQALLRAGSYKIEMRIPSNPNSPERFERWQIHLPEDPQLFVLFTSAGTLLDCESETVLPSGNYLVLAHIGRVADFFARSGVQQLDMIPITPIGWQGWQGWKIRLDPGADIAPFSVEPVEDRAKWSLEEPPNSDVIWRTLLPVWTGRLPRLFLDTPDAFTDAILEVISEDPTIPSESKYLRIGTDVKLNAEGGEGRTFLDLVAIPQLHNSYGQLLLRCRPLQSVDNSPLTARCVRLPDVRLTYIEDPTTKGNVLAVRVESDFPLTALIPGPGTQILTGQGRPHVAILSAVTPLTQPVVIARFSKKAGELQIRIPVSRGALLTPQEALANWQPLPIDDLELRSIGLEDRLRIELHETPLLDIGRILFRFSSGVDVWAGEPFRREQQANVFEVELHRLRDAFGIGIAGVIQVRTESRWIEVARLRGQPREVRTSIHLPPPRHQLLEDLERAVAEGNEKAAENAVATCFRRRRDEGASVIEAELLPIVAARTVLGMATRREQLEVAAAAITDLATRTDLPEAKSLCQLLRLRCLSLLASEETWCHDVNQRIQNEVLDCSEKNLLQGECYYHYARSLRTPADACWRSCSFHLEQYLASSAGRGFQSHYSDAILLAELARVMQCQVPKRIEPYGSDDLPICPRHQPWIEAVRLLGKMVRSPSSGRETIPMATPLPETFPQVIRQEDVTLLRIAVSQAQDGELARQLLSRLQDWTPDQFCAIGLLRARQARADGRVGVAFAEYDRLFVQAKAAGPDELLDIVVAERQSCRQ